jgi:hypothetical protein
MSELHCAAAGTVMYHAEMGKNPASGAGIGASRGRSKSCAITSLTNLVATEWRFLNTLLFL